MLTYPTAIVTESAVLPFKSIGPYAIHSRIGSGGMGNVYLAQHRFLNTWVAIKLLAPHVIGAPSVADRFRQEMKAIGKLKHPNIISASNAGEEDGIPFLVMEYVPGRDLRVLLQDHGTFSVPIACELARQTALALTCIDASGMVHRDIKPSNLLLGADGVLRVLDLGVARMQPDSSSDPLTPAGNLMGTGDYIAPEQADNCRAVDIRADIYSLGCTLYAMLRGSPPFSDPRFDNLVRKIRAHQEAPVPPIRDFRSDVPARLGELLDLMLAKDPAARIASPEEVVAALAEFTEGASPAAYFGESIGRDSGPVPLAGNQETPTAWHETAVTVPYRLAGRRATGRLMSRRWFMAGAAAAVAAGAGVGLWRALRITPAPAAKPAPQGDGNADSLPERPPFEPGRWYDLLDRPPKVLVWPPPSVGPDSSWDYDPQKRELRAKCTDRSAFELANVNANRFEFEVNIVQHPAVGGVGLIYGFKPREIDAGTKFEANLLMFEPFSKFSDPKEVRLIWGAIGIPPRMRRSPYLELEMSELVKQPPTGELRLRIKVGPAGLERIECDDNPLAPKLWGLQHHPSTDVGTAGGIGVYIGEGSASIRRARLRLLSEGDTK